jgi:DNA-binding GntR family transcriptional regulator/alkylhydroperoxidase/carboxymuconolactone decarboxylase family protein YurZ
VAKATGCSKPAASTGTQSLRREVEDKLRRAIVKGDFGPGEHLSERALCENFKVSRAIVREGVRQLEAEGLVVSRPNRGSFVRVLTAAEAAQIFDVRALLEAWATRKFVQSASEEQRRGLIAELEDLKRSISKRKKTDLVASKQKYYDKLFGAYENPYIQETLNRVQNWGGQLRAVAMSVPARIPKTIAELDRLIAAIEAQDGEAAWQASLAHVRNAAIDALSVLGEQGPPMETRPNAQRQAQETTAGHADTDLRMRREILGDMHVDPTFDDFERPLRNLITEYGEGEIRTRPNLDCKTRLLLNLAFLTALNRPHDIELNVREALKNGVTKTEMTEVFLQSAIYCGVPAATESLKIARKVLDEN